MAAGSAAIALVAVLAACSGSSGSPQVLPPLSTTPAASASTPPPQDPKAAAVAVVREYFRLLNNLPHDMDYRSLASLMAATCSCQEQVHAIRAARLRGQHYVDHWENLTLASVINGPKSVDVLAEYDAASGGLVDKKGRRITSAPPKAGVKRLFRVELQGTKWLISSISAA